MDQELQGLPHPNMVEDTKHGMAPELPGAIRRNPGGTPGPGTPMGGTPLGGTPSGNPEINQIQWSFKGF